MTSPCFKSKMSIHSALQNKQNQDHQWKLNFSHILDAKIWLTHLKCWSNFCEQYNLSLPLLNKKNTTTAHLKQRKPAGAVLQAQLLESNHKICAEFKDAGKVKLLHGVFYLLYNELVALLVVTKISEKIIWISYWSNRSANYSELTILLSSDRSPKRISHAGPARQCIMLRVPVAPLQESGCLNFVTTAGISVEGQHLFSDSIWSSNLGFWWFWAKWWQKRRPRFGLVFCKDQFWFIYSILFQCWKTVHSVVVPEFLHLPTPRIGKKPNMRWQAWMRAVGVRFLKQHILLV